MSKISEQYKDRIISLSEENGDIVMSVDGYYVFWLEGRGFMEATDLRIIADHLDKRNEKWDKEIKEYFDAQGDAGGGDEEINF